MMPLPQRLLRTLARVLLLCSAAGATAPLHARQPQREPASVNPFAAVETFRLPNGLRVWYGYLPAASTTSMAVIVPYGRDHDEPGREQTAHLLEHVLLSDRHGRSEAELARELTGQGGRHNGVTGPRYTTFLVDIATDQAAFGVRWLHDVVAPRRLHDDLVDRNRAPVAVELSGHRAGLRTGAAGRLLLHPWLLPEPFWQREFGVVAQEERRNDPHRSLAAITTHDVQTFFDTRYASTAMTLVIITGVARGELQPTIDSTFALLPWRPTPPADTAYRPRTAESRLFQYHTGVSSRLVLRYRITRLNGLEHLRLLFIGDLLRYRLMERLRRGEDKAVYSIAAVTTMRGPAAFLGIHVDLDPREERRVRAIIEDELARISDAATDTVAFYADRDALGSRLRAENASPAALRAWATDHFHHPGLHDRFPDLGEYYANVGPDSIAAFAARLFVDDARILYVWRPLPAPAAALAAAALMLVLAGAKLYCRAVLVPADMTRVRYITRIRPPLLARITAATLAALVGIIGGRFIFAAGHILARDHLLAVDNGFLALTVGAALLPAAAIACLATIGTIPHKVVVFEHELRIKSPTCRSRIVPRSTIAAVDVVAHRRDFRGPVLPPFGRGVRLTLADGSTLLLRVRSPELLAASLNSAPAALTLPTARVVPT